MANVVFDEQSAERIAKAVKWVEQFSLDETTDDNTADDPSADSSARTVIRGTFSGEWAKNTAKDVAFTADNGDSGTKSDVYNYFADVGAEGETSACLIIQAGSEWVLVSAKPVAECIELSKVEPSGNLTLLSAINPTGSFLQSISGSVVTSVACVNGNLTVTTESISNLATSANLSDVIGYTETTVGLEAFANITTQNYTLPKQEGCG